MIKDRNRSKSDPGREILQLSYLTETGTTTADYGFTQKEEWHLSGVNDILTFPARSVVGTGSICV
jgi:hypothetical protein